jgi:hypothetical protein
MEHLNSIYYSLSTISQVLSGFIALSGVFVLFKLQSLDKIQLMQAQYFYNYMSGSGLNEGSFHGCPTVAVKLKTLRMSESTDGIVEEINIILNDEKVKQISQYNSLKNWASIIQKVEKIKRRIKTLAQTSIIVGVCTIIFSIVILSLNHLLCKSFAVLFMNISVVLTVISITTMTWSIILSLKSHKILR